MLVKIINRNVYNTALSTGLEMFAYNKVSV